MKTINKYILGILLSSVLIVTGCGSSSSNNPVGNGEVSSGLVSVSGNVKNSNGNGTVSFYTPTAIYGSSLNSNLRTSVANNEVYTFNIDENGNYNGQIPSGDYYVIAQNSDGSMKYASKKQNFAIRAELGPYDFELVPTITISGILTLIDAPSGTIVDVYLEDMPFVDLNVQFDTNQEGYPFTMNFVPLEDSYTICSNVWLGDTRFRFSTTLNKNDIKRNLNLDNNILNVGCLSEKEPISLSGTSINIEYPGTLPTNTTIIAITDNKILAAIAVEYNEAKTVLRLLLNSNSEVNILLIKTDNSDNSDYKAIIVNSEMLSSDGKTITIPTSSLGN